MFPKIVEMIFETVKKKIDTRVNALVTGYLIHTFPVSFFRSSSGTRHAFHLRIICVHTTNDKQAALERPQFTFCRVFLDPTI